LDSVVFVCRKIFIIVPTYAHIYVVQNYVTILYVCVFFGTIINIKQ
jgi:hypothetical protein